MTAATTHLNLLQAREVVSSSPVRLRVMVPVATLLACAAMILWWVILYSNILLCQAEVRTLRNNLEARAKDHARILGEMGRACELEAELEQLSYYAHARHPWGETLTKLAEAVPLKVQFTRIEIPTPPPQNLARPKGSKLPPLWGPTDAVERVSLVLSGRTTKETPISALMETLEGEDFTNALVIVRDPRAANRSPNVRSFRQEATGTAGPRLLAFEIEYAARERRFAP